MKQEAAKEKWTKGEYLREGTTVYSLHIGENDTTFGTPTNRFWAQVQTQSCNRASGEELTAVANLFAASPEMYEALKDLLANHERRGWLCHPEDNARCGKCAHCKAEDVLKKALGEQ